MKLGCELQEKFGNTWWSSKKVVSILASDSFGRFIYFRNKKVFSSELEDYKILGTPPDLSRVLWWMRENEGEEKQNRGTGIVNSFTSHTFFYEPRQEELPAEEILLEMWDLEKSLLRDQSPKVWEFLYDLLIQK